MAILIELQDFTNQKKTDFLKKLVTVNKLSLLKVSIFLYNLPSNLKRIEFTCQILKLSATLPLLRTLTMVKPLL